MSKIISSKDIGLYRLSIDDDGTLTLHAPHLHAPVTFEAGQALELVQWLSQQQDLLHTKTVVPLAETVTPAAPAEPENSEEIVQRIIKDAITQAREHYPAGLDFEHRDRFIDQIARDPTIKPLLAQGQITRKQIMLWIGQQLDTGTEPLWTQDQKRGRKKS